MGLIYHIENILVKEYSVLQLFPWHLYIYKSETVNTIYSKTNKKDINKEEK